MRERPSTPRRRPPAGSRSARCRARRACRWRRCGPGNSGTGSRRRSASRRATASIRSSIVPRLRRMAEAIARGHRAGDVVPATDAALDRLLPATATSADARPAAADARHGVRSTTCWPWSRRSTPTGSPRRCWPTGAASARSSSSDASRRSRARRAGNGPTGRLEIRHEHFLSERLGDLLRSLRLPLDHRATGPVGRSARRCRARPTRSACRWRRCCWPRPACAWCTSAPRCRRRNWRRWPRELPAARGGAQRVGGGRCRGGAAAPAPAAAAAARPGPAAGRRPRRARPGRGVVTVGRLRRPRALGAAAAAPAIPRRRSGEHASDDRPPRLADPPARDGAPRRARPTPTAAPSSTGCSAPSAARDNPALDVADRGRQRARAAGGGVLRPDAGLPGREPPPLRVHGRGLPDIAARPAGRARRLRPAPRSAITTSRASATRCGAALVVGDENPLREPERWRRDAAARLRVPFWTVDADVVVPTALLAKEQFAARTIRPRMRPLIPPFLAVRASRARGSRGEPAAGAGGLPAAADAVGAAARSTRRRRPVAPASRRRPAPARRAGAGRFLRERLRGYADGPQPPGTATARASSRRTCTSATSARARWRARCATPTRRARTATRSSRSSSSGASWRSTSCAFNPRYDSLEGCEPWARRTLEAHRRDQREPRYSVAQLEAADTHDPLWNAAQIQMVETGWMHGYVRMYWAKKILEWTRDAGGGVRDRRRCSTTATSSTAATRTATPASRGPSAASTTAPGARSARSTARCGTCRSRARRASSTAKRYIRRVEEETGRQSKV